MKDWIAAYESLQETVNIHVKKSQSDGDAPNVDQKQVVLNPVS
jgi:hypothetical protein